MNVHDAQNQTRGHKKRARTHAQLTDAGVEAYAALGGALTVRDVVERAGVSNGTFYNYFDDLDAFVEAVVLHVLEGLAQEVAFSGSPDPARRFVSATYQGLTVLYNNPAWAHVVLRIATKPDAAPDFSRFLAFDLAEGHTQGRFTMQGDALTVDIVLGAILMVLRRIASGSASEELVREMVQRLLEVLGIETREAAALVAEAAAHTPQTDPEEDLP